MMKEIILVSVSMTLLMLVMTGGIFVLDEYYFKAQHRVVTHDETYALFSCIKAENIDVVRMSDVYNIRMCLHNNHFELNYTRR